MPQERVVYLNGNIVPESQALIPYFDRGLTLGEGVFDTARTFRGRVFKLEAHIDRLYRSLAYIGLDPGLSRGEMMELVQEVVQRNLPLLGPNEDYWVTVRVTRGPHREGYPSRPTVVIDCTPLPLRQRARYFRHGVPVITPSVRRTPPWALSPRAKTLNYLNLLLAQQEADALAPGSWPILLDENGNLCEGLGCNIFILSRGRLLTPRERYVLPGISRETVMELAPSLGIPVEERDIDLYDTYNAEEVFVTATSICLCWVSTVNGRPVGKGDGPGPVTRRLLQAWSDLVGLDIAGQYLAFLQPEEDTAQR